MSSGGLSGPSRTAVASTRWRCSTPERDRTGPRGRKAHVKQKIIINADSYETRIAILEDDELAELFVERAEQRRHVGDIYRGRVNAVLPGMQSAFVDLG